MEKASTRTFAPIKWSKDPRGFSLIELLVVVAMIGLISLFALPSVTSIFKLSLNTAAREMAALVKETYNSTVMTGKVHRIVFSIKENAYWVESGPNTVLLDTAESKEREERKRRFGKDADKEPPSEFGMDKSITRGKVSLPTGVEFEDIVSEQGKEPIVEGTAYTHFFPHGLTEQTVIHLKDQSDHHISLVVSSIIGRTRVEERYLTREEAYGK